MYLLQHVAAWGWRCWSAPKTGRTMPSQCPELWNAARRQKDIDADRLWPVWFFFASSLFNVDRKIKISHIYAISHLFIISRHISATPSNTRWIKSLSKPLWASKKFTKDNTAPTAPTGPTGPTGPGVSPVCGTRCLGDLRISRGRRCHGRCMEPLLKDVAMEFTRLKDVRSCQVM